MSDEHTCQTCRHWLGLGGDTNPCQQLSTYRDGTLTTMEYEGQPLKTPAWFSCNQYEAIDDE